MSAPMALVAIDPLGAAITAQTYDTVTLYTTPESLVLLSTFVWSAGGTTAKAWVQTSLDGGTSWADIASFAATTASKTRVYHLTAVAVSSIATPTDGSLADDTAVNGVLGTMFRVKVTTTGTYTGATSWKIWAIAR